MACQWRAAARHPEQLGHRMYRMGTAPVAPDRLGLNQGDEPGVLEDTNGDFGSTGAHRSRHGGNSRSHIDP